MNTKTEWNYLTLKERERMAYAQGDVEMSRLLCKAWEAVICHDGWAKMDLTDSISRGLPDRQPMGNTLQRLLTDSSR